jgi:hypothetical protein
MRPKVDLFHQVLFQGDGYVAIINYMEHPFPQVNVYDPHGEWCGCTNSLNEASRLAAVRHIIRTRRRYLWCRGREKHIIRN